MWLRKTILTLLLFLFFVPMQAQITKLDFVNMRNGNQYVGTITQINDTSISIIDIQIGLVLIKQSSVKELVQEDRAKQYKVKLANQNVFTGKLADFQEQGFYLETDLYGKLFIPFYHVAELQQIQTDAVVKGEYRFPNPNYTRYLFAPSAFPMTKGEWYYQNAYIIANSANYGVTSNITLGGGIIIPFAAYITPKIGFKITDYFHVAAGGIYSLLPAFDEEEDYKQIALGYGVLTLGNIEYNISAGVGYGYIGSSVQDNPVITVCGTARLTRRVAFVTENWMIPYKVADFPEERFATDILYTYGVRFLWERFAIDAAFANNRAIAENMFIGIPYIDFAMKF